MLVLTLSMAFCTNVAAAQPADGTASPGFIAMKWNVGNGLPVEYIREVVHTRDGYLWLATHDGLVRFDGHRFTVFDANNTPALPSNRIQSMLKASDGSLWIHLDDKHLVRHRKGIFTLYRSEDHFGGDPVLSFYVDPADVL